VNDAPKSQPDFAEADQSVVGEQTATSSTFERDLLGLSEEIAKLEPRNFAATLHHASEAVTTLADRLNAVMLRSALLDAARNEPGVANLESYMSRLAVLIDSTAEQMRLIQRLLAAIEAATRQSVRDPHQGRG